MIGLLFLSLPALYVELRSAAQRHPIVPSLVSRSSCLSLVVVYVKPWLMCVSMLFVWRGRILTLLLCRRYRKHHGKAYREGVGSVAVSLNRRRSGQVLASS